MEPLHIPATTTTPEIRLDNESGQITIQGVSDEVDAIGYYYPAQQWVEAYVRQPAPDTILDIRLTNFNAASSKALFGIIACLAPLLKTEHSLKVNWYYDTNNSVLNENFKQYSDSTSVPVNVAASNNS